MLFRQNPCRKSHKGVYLYRVKSQKDVKYGSSEIAKRYKKICTWPNLLLTMCRL